MFLNFSFHFFLVKFLVIKIWYLAISGTKPLSSLETLTSYLFLFPLAEEFHLFHIFFSLIPHLHHHCRPSSHSFSATHPHLLLILPLVSTEDAHQRLFVFAAIIELQPAHLHCLPHRHFFTLFTLSGSLSLLCSLLLVVVVVIVTISNVQATVQRRGW